MLKLRTLFSGIGAPEKALKRLGIDYELVDFCEVDKYAVTSYCAVHNEPSNKNLGDITKVWGRGLPHANLMVWGFPCTDISIAGKQEGVIEGVTRSGLYYDGKRILHETKPEFSVIENVKNLASKKFKPVLDQILKDLDSEGYNSYYEVLNAKDYRVPQNRERIFIVSIRKDVDKGNFKFPQPEPLELKLKDLLESEVDERYYFSEDKTASLIESLKNKEISNTVRIGGHGSLDRHSWDLVAVQTGILINEGELKIKSDVANCLDANYHKGLDNHGQRTGILVVGELDMMCKDEMKRVYSPEGISPTLTTMEGENRQPKIINNLRVRKLTPLECWRLMNFDDEDFYRAQEAGVSNSQLYKQAGNSIVVAVLERIFKNLLEGF